MKFANIVNNKQNIITSIYEILYVGYISQLNILCVWYIDYAIDIYEICRSTNARIFFLIIICGLHWNPSPFDSDYYFYINVVVDSDQVILV